uniref:Chitin-binding type-2 domain-containing protein n=1 Tax=Graphocephala atropunctata TaxID=36148 RepID=A0A1B6L764_9HEMI
MSPAWMYGVVALTLLALLTLTDGSLLHRPQHSVPAPAPAPEHWLVYTAAGDGLAELEGLPPPPPGQAELRRRRASAWRKRVHREHEAEGGGRLGHLMTRTRRGNRQYDMHQMGPHGRDGPYDVPQIDRWLYHPEEGPVRHLPLPTVECPPAEEDGMERFACPTPDRTGRYRCIDDHVLCDGFIDCPSGEDEDRQACMFYKTTKAHLDILADALLRWARGR